MEIEIIDLVDGFRNKIERAIHFASTDETIEDDSFTEHANEVLNLPAMEAIRSVLFLLAQAAAADKATNLSNATPNAFLRAWRLPEEVCNWILSAPPILP